MRQAAKLDDWTATAAERSGSVRDFVELGKPRLSVFDDDEDDAGENLTAMVTEGGMMERAAAMFAKPGAAPQPPGSGPAGGSPAPVVPPASHPGLPSPSSSGARFPLSSSGARHPRAGPPAGYCGYAQPQIPQIQHQTKCPYA